MHAKKKFRKSLVLLKTRKRLTAGVSKGCKVDSIGGCGKAYFEKGGGGQYYSPPTTTLGGQCSKFSAGAPLPPLLKIDEQFPHLNLAPSAFVKHFAQALRKWVFDFKKEGGVVSTFSGFGIRVLGIFGEQVVLLGGGPPLIPPPSGVFFLKSTLVHAGIPDGLLIFQVCNAAATFSSPKYSKVSKLVKFESTKNGHYFH